MKKKLSLFISFLLCAYSLLAQQNIDATIKLNRENKILKIKQKITYTNSNNFSINTLCINDWNHAYSNIKTPLAQYFSNQYIRTFHLASNKERGFTTLNRISSNNINLSYKRLEHQTDIIIVQIPILQPQQSIELAIEYDLQIPNTKFNEWGTTNNNYYLKNFLLLISKQINTNNSITYSNTNTDDQVLEPISNLTLHFDVPLQYKITSNLNETLSYTFNSKNGINYQVAIEQNKSFSTYVINHRTIENNLQSKKLSEIDKTLLIERVVNYVNTYIPTQETSKIMVSQNDYNNNPFYGLNQLPHWINPFSNSFLYELQFLKTYTHNFLKNELRLDYRKEHYILDALEHYIIINYIEAYYPNEKLIGTLANYKLIKNYELAKLNFSSQFYYAYLLMARKNLDQSLYTSSDKLIKFNQQIALKYKAGLSLKYLESYLGKNTINTSITQFINQNKTKFTNLKNFENILKANTNKNIDWFFKEFIYDTTPIDYALKKINKQKDSLAVFIKRNTNSAIPFLLTATHKNKKIYSQWFSLNTKNDTILMIKKDSISHLEINSNPFFTEINKKNNFAKVPPRLFKKPLKLSFLTDIENPKYHQLFYYPEIGYTLYDGAILNLTTNTTSLIEQPFNFELSPSYSTHTRSITGTSFINYNLNYPNKTLYQTRLSLSTAYYHYAPQASYFRIIPSITFRLRDKDILNNYYQSLSLKYTFVNKQASSYTNNQNTPLQYAIFNIRYTISQSETAKAHSLSTNIQLGNTMGKIMAEVNYRKQTESNHQWSYRFYAGSFIYNHSNSNYYNFGIDRPKDYLFEYPFYGRSETSGFYSQQIIIAEGGFKSKFKNPYPNQWIAALNTTTSLWKWINFYTDLGFYKNKNTSAKFIYDSGIHFNIIPDYFEVYCPLYSNNGWEITQNEYLTKLRFQFTLNPKSLIGIFNRKWF